MPPRKKADEAAPVTEETVVAEGWSPVGAAAKLAYIQSHIRNVEKTGRNDHHKYDYFQEHGLLDLLRPMLRELRCAIVPSPSGVSYTRDGNRAMVSGYLDFIDTEQSPHYIDQHGAPLMSPAGVPVENPNYRVRAYFSNEGTDAQDKATNKALTGWMKYALQKMFAVPTEKVDDADHPDVTAAGARSAAPPKIDAKIATEYANGPLKQAVENGAVSKAQVVAKLATYRASAPGQLNTQQFDEFAQWVEAAVEQAEGQP